MQPYDRRRNRGAPAREQNPFELAHSHMGSMMGQMMGGGLLGGGGLSGSGRGGMGSMMDQMMGSMGGMGGMGDMQSMQQSMMGGGGGGGGGSTCSYSCSSYSSSSGGPGGHSVSYSSSSHGVQQPGQEAVYETNRKYHDSSGQEKIGVSRHIGGRGRSIVAERGADGTERRTDDLLNVDDGSAFDREWRSNGAATRIGQARTQARSHAPALGGGTHAPALGGGLGNRAEERIVEVSDADRGAARDGRHAYEAQRDRMIAEARRERSAAGSQPQSRAPTNSRSSGGSVPHPTLMAPARQHQHQQGSPHRSHHHPHHHQLSWGGGR